MIYKVILLTPSKCQEYKIYNISSMTGYSAFAVTSKRTSSRLFRTRVDSSFLENRTLFLTGFKPNQTVRQHKVMFIQISHNFQARSRQSQLAMITWAMRLSAHQH
jgi:hypothetical protein